MYTAREYRRHLTAIDDALIVHRYADGRFQLELRPMVKLASRGAKSYGAALRQLAADLEAGYRAVIVDRDNFLSDLEQLAREHATDKDRDEIERAAQVVAERTRHQVWDSLFEAPAEYRMGRMLLAARQRRTKADRDEQNGLNCMFGIPTPRTEQLWHSLRHQWCSPRSNAAGKAAWENWCRANRPNMPKVEAA
ncbi:hypothetical protein XM50_17215 [Sphingomonas sp. Ag1]|nr:hypothetical protein XM50_17215 [Sphingomonas sp. Ag1]